MVMLLHKNAALYWLQVVINCLGLCEATHIVECCNNCAAINIVTVRIWLSCQFQ